MDHGKLTGMDYARSTSFLHQLNVSRSIPSLPIKQRAEKRAAIESLICRLPSEAAGAGSIQLPDDKNCPRSFGNWHNLVLSALMVAQTLRMRLSATSSMDCNSLLRFKLAHRVLPVKTSLYARSPIQLSASDACDRLSSPAFSMQMKETLQLPVDEHGQETPWCLQRRFDDSARGGTSDSTRRRTEDPSALFALGPHAAFGAIFDTSFALLNESVPTWRAGEVRISVHVRHFNVRETGEESLDMFQAAIRRAVQSAQWASCCAVLVASDRRKTLELMGSIAASVGCRLLHSARSEKKRDFSLEHGEDTGVVVLRDVFLLAHGHLLIGTWGSTLTTTIQQLVAYRCLRHHSTWVPTVTYCELTRGECMPALPLLTNKGSEWFVNIGRSGAARIFSSTMMAKVVSRKEWSRRDELLRQQPMGTTGSDSCRPLYKVRRARGGDACQQGRTFGCFDGGLRMWVSGRCGGVFQCGPNKVLCSHVQGNSSAPTRTVCVCEGSAIGWPSADEAIASLSRLEQPLHQTAHRGSWLAAIISANESNLRFTLVARAVASCGFLARHVLAARPEQFSSLSAMVLELFGTPRVRTARMSPYELGRLISHKRALKVIAHAEFSWGAVFEDDATINAAVPPSVAGYLIAQSMAAAGNGRLLYLGACSPSCLSPEQQNEANGSGLPPGLLRGGRCSSYCTHAYAISRRLAATLFEDVFECWNGSSRCGAECATRPCFADWAYVRHFARGRGEAWIVGGGLVSPDLRYRDHRGLFVQNRSSVLGNQETGTSLSRNYRWQRLPKTGSLAKFSEAAIRSPGLMMKARVASKQVRTGGKDRREVARNSKGRAEDVLSSRRSRPSSLARNLLRGFIFGLVLALALGMGAALVLVGCGACVSRP